MQEEMYYTVRAIILADYSYKVKLCLGKIMLYFTFETDLIHG